MYSSIYSALRLFMRGGMETRQHLNELRRTQWFSREELEAYQFQKLQGIVKHAYDNIPYYRDLYRKLDIHPEDIKSFKDFQSLPILSKQEIMPDVDRFVWSQMKDRAIVVRTGSSTGEPLPVYVSDSFWWWNAAYEFRGRGWHGIHEGDKMAWIWGAHNDMYDWSWQARLKARIMRHRYLNAFGLTEDKMKDFAEMLLKWKPAMFRTYTTPLFLFAQYLKANNITGIRPKMIETTSEKLRPNQRALAEEVFQTKIVECYAAREFGTVAYTCEAGRLHVGETFYMEIVSDEGKPVPDGELGDVVVTSLTQYVMPFIRYRLNDEAYFSEDDCPCGRKLPALKEIKGRTNDYIVTPEGKYVGGGFFASALWDKPEVVRYQVHQTDKHHVEILLLLNKQVSQGWLDSLRDEVKSHLSDSMTVQLRVVDDIPLTRVGKHRFVVSDVDQNWNQQRVSAP